DLARVWEKRPPSRLEVQRIVSLAEEGEQGQASQRSLESGLELQVEGFVATRIAEVIVKGADTMGDLGAVSVSRRPVQVPPDAKRRRGDARQESSRGVQPAKGAASHQRQHPAERPTRRPPAE